MKVKQFVLGSSRSFEKRAGYVKLHPRTSRNYKDSKSSITVGISGKEVKRWKNGEEGSDWVVEIQK
jgi:hypothetical protein